MRNKTMFCLLFLLFACNQSGSKNSKTAPSNKSAIISDSNNRLGEINKSINSYKKVEQALMGESAEGGELVSYSQNGALKKVIASYYGEMGKSQEEYYFNDNNLFFALEQNYSYDKPIHVAGSKVKEMKENRYYLNQNKLISWLDPDKKEVAQAKLGQKEVEVLQKIKAIKEKFTDNKTVYSWVDPLNIRDQASTKGKVITTVDGDKALALTESKSEKMATIVLRGVAYEDYWYKVRTTDGKEGWVFGGAVKQKNEQKGNAIVTKEKFDFPHFGAFDLSEWKKTIDEDYDGGDVEGTSMLYKKGNQLLELSESDMGDYGFSYRHKLMSSDKKVLKERTFGLSPSMQENVKNKLVEEVKDYTVSPSQKHTRVQEIGVSHYKLKPRPVMATGSWKMESLAGAMSNAASINMKSLLSSSPSSIFDESAAGISNAEKATLAKKGKSESWEITEETDSKLVIQGEGNDGVQLYFLKNKNNSDGQLAVETTNGKTSSIQLWKYSDNDKNFVKASPLKKFSANAFVSPADKLPNDYRPQLHYQFIDDQTIEVSLYTWMDNAFENREIINKIFLKWNGENFEEQIVKNGQVQGAKKFGLLDKPIYDLSKLNKEGKIVHKRFWQDANGENIALFTRNKAELFLYHYAINEDNVKLLRKVTDFEKDCDYDLFLDFIKNSIKVTNLDNNNFGELTFAYNKACISDVSPKGLKLIMLENGNKFIMRGTTSINKPGLKVDGTKNVDVSFKDAPANFLSHANKIWESINT